MPLLGRWWNRSSCVDRLGWCVFFFHSKCDRGSKGAQTSFADVLLCYDVVLLPSCAMLAKEGGYDGVEVMGSEGYLINQFLVKHTNKR